VLLYHEVSDSEQDLVPVFGLVIFFLLSPLLSKGKGLKIINWLIPWGNGDERISRLIPWNDI